MARPAHEFIPDTTTPNTDRPDPERERYWRELFERLATEPAKPNR